MLQKEWSCMLQYICEACEDKFNLKHVQKVEFKSKYNIYIQQNCSAVISVRLSVILKIYLKTQAVQP